MNCFPSESEGISPEVSEQLLKNKKASESQQKSGSESIFHPGMLAQTRSLELLLSCALAALRWEILSVTEYNPLAVVATSQVCAPKLDLNPACSDQL